MPKTKRTRNAKASRGPTNRHSRLFPPGYEDALKELRKPGLEITFRLPPGSTRPTAEELQAGLAPTLAHFKMHIDGLTSKLRRQLEALPCLQVLSALAVTTAFRDPETYRESETRYSAIHAEYPAWLYLTAPERPLMTADILDSGAMQKVFDLLDEIAAATQSYYECFAAPSRRRPLSTQARDHRLGIWRVGSGRLPRDDGGTARQTPRRPLPHEGRDSSAGSMPARSPVPRLAHGSLDQVVVSGAV